MNKLTAATLVVAATLLQPAVAGAQEEGPFMVRVRGLALLPRNGSDSIPALGVPSDAIHVSKKGIPELDLSWFFTRHLAAELVLTYPQEHDVTVSGTKIGTFHHLPPSLLAQWHFLPGTIVDPYLGAGVNITFITSTSLSIPGVGALDLSSPSVGPAAQVGFDIRLAPHWYLNVDAKWIMLRTDVKLADVKVSQLQVDPFLVGGGIGYRL